MTNKKINTAILIGKGGRLKAIYNCAKKINNLDIRVVISHKKESPGVDWAKKKGIESFYFRLTDFKKQKKSREEFYKKLAEILKKRKINFIVMAGWDLILSNEFLKKFPEQVINIHPSLCPAFPGLDAPQQALNYGVKYTGCTLHFVPDEGVDTGPIILQRVVKIEPKDKLEDLEKKIHKKEEEILCEGIKLFADGKLKIKGRKVILINKNQ